MHSDLGRFIEEQFTSETLQATANFIGEPAANTQAAIHTAVPLVVAGYINKASSQDGLKELYEALHPVSGSSHSYLDINDNPNASTDFNSYVNYADGIVNLVFGLGLSKLPELVEMESGIRKESATQLFSLIASMVAGMIRSKITTEGLGLSGLANFLMGQAEGVKIALPSTATTILGLEELGNYRGDTNTPAIDPDKINMRMLMPWFIGLVALLVSLYYIRSCSKAIQPVTKADIIDSLALTRALDSAEVAATADTVKIVKNVFIVKNLPGNIELKVPSYGVESRLLAFIEDPTKPVNKDTWFEFDRLYFKSASAELEPTSEEQLNNITSILNAYPKVRIKLGGYTDNTGNPADNLKLSADRAKTAMNALISKGINKSRLSSEGYGDQYPLGDNSTEEGRAQNRRIAIRIIEK